MKKGWQMKNWEKKKLSDLSRNKNAVVSGPFGSNLKVSDYINMGVPILRLQNVGKGFFINKDIKYISDKKANELKYHSFKAGDLVLAKLGIPIGKTCIVPDEFPNGIIVADVVRIRPDKKLVDYKFLEYFLNTDDVIGQLTGSITGATRPRVNLSDVRGIELNLPSLPEQKRIVTILDETFTAIDKAKANAEQNLKNVKELFEGYLRKMFENENWETKTLKVLTTKIGSGATPRGGQKSYKSEGISLVRSMNVHDWEFRQKNLAFIDENQAKELDGVTLQEDDVLLNITGASVARCCVFPKEYIPARVNQHVSIIRPKKELLNARFLNLLLTSKPYKDQLLFTGGQGATRQAITKAQIESFKISIPPLKEQQTIVHQLDALLAETHKLEVVYKKKITDFEELKKSILHQAFSGNL